MFWLLSKPIIDYVTIIFLSGQPDNTIVKCKKDGNETLHTFSYFNPDVDVKYCSQDAKSEDFLSFSVIDMKSNKTVEKFRADDIVQMRNFMASLGSTKVGVFSPKSVFAMDLPDIQPADVSQVSAGTYIDTIKQLPTAFYFPKNFGLSILDSPAGAKPAILSKPLPQFSANLPRPSKESRPWSDAFRPPVGPAIYQPISMGYGAEVGLKAGQQAIWDPHIKSCCLLDHKDKKRVNGDPRKQSKKVPPLTQQYHKYGSMYRIPDLEKTYKVCRDPAILKEAKKCAELKPRAWTLVACGSKGNDGRNGQSGRSGADGHPGATGVIKGACGGAGGNGGVGESGFDAQAGDHGTAASDIVLFLDGDANELKIKGTCEMTAKLGGLQHEEVFFVNCRGGDGGKGGNGGHAGYGGDAGAGGHGAPGKKGTDSFGYTRGGDGKPGGNGGNGGNGGVGGVGGSGAKGGNAGAGGICTICAADPKLMMLVEADCTAGTLGKGGSAGKGGNGGRGGLKGVGGPGGPGGRGTLQSQYVKDGVTYVTLTDAPGRQGRNGYDGGEGNFGSNGKDGMAAKDGFVAKHGGIAWVVFSKDSQILQQSPTRYNVQIKRFQVNCEHNDQIFEPNEQITVSEIVLVNNGGLPLPAGAELLMESSNTINFEPTRFKLPEILPGKSVRVQSNFRGRICDLPTPNSPGPLLTNAEFRSRVELLGRPFLDSLVPRKLQIQYPVKLASLKCNESVGRDEVTTFEIQVENISDKPYGSCEGSAGEVGLQLQMNAQLIPFASTSANNDTPPPYTITYNASVRNSLYVEIHKLQPKEKLKVSLVVQLSSKADLFDRCDWQANLCLRGKVIEYNFQKIRVSPIYTPSTPPADILMVTSAVFTHRDFIYWQHILKILGATTDFWDTTRYRGFSEDTTQGARHSPTWVGQYRGRLILFPQFNCSLLRGKDIVDHFHGDVGQQERINLGSGMILFLPNTPPRNINEEKYLDHGDAPVILHLALSGESLPLPKDGYSGKHMTKPTSLDSCLKWEENTLQQLEKEDPSRSVCVASRKVDIQSKGLMKYSYGEVDLRRCPLKRSSKLMVVDGAGGSIAFMGKDDPNFSNETENCPLGSSFGQALLHTLYGLPLRFKLALIKGLKPNQDETTLLQASQITFSLPNEFLLTLDQLSAICAAKEIADEVLDGSKSLASSKLFLKDVQDNKHIYSSKTEIVTQTLSLLEKELQACKKSFDYSPVSQAIKECKKILSQVQKEIQSSSKKKRRSSTHEQVLPNLAQLQDGLHVHYSHRHAVKDERWNLDFHLKV